MIDGDNRSKRGLLWRRSDTSRHALHSTRRVRMQRDPDAETLGKARLRVGRGARRPRCAGRRAQLNGDRLASADHILRRTHNMERGARDAARRLRRFKRVPSIHLEHQTFSTSEEWKMLSAPRGATWCSECRSSDSRDAPGPEVAESSPSRVETVLAHDYRWIREHLTANPKRWLVTGVAGFIGSNLLEALLGLGQEVVGLDDLSTGYRSNVDDALSTHPDAKARFTFIEGDIRDRASCAAACRGVDYVLHQAALASVPRSIDDPAIAHSVNVDGFFNLLLAAKNSGVRRLVYASSSAVYGDVVDQPQTEGHIGRPLSPYAANKAINETYASAFHTAYGFESIGLRYYNIFGPRQDPDGAYAAVIPRWIMNLTNGAPCAIFGDGETTRDFCYVANVVQANLLAATSENPDAVGQVYNIGCSRSMTLNQVFAMISALVSARQGGARVSTPLYKPFRTGDIRHSSGSIEKARRLLGYVPSYDVADGLAELLSRCPARPAPSFAPLELRALRGATA